LRSFVTQGHEVVLHAYERPDNVPDGVVLSDASELLPASAILRYTDGGSPAIHADFLRYEILARGLGLYVDCDCYCLKPVEDAESVYGWESRTRIANAVLKLPSDSPVLTELRRLRVARAFVPPWASPRRRAYYRARAALGVPVRLQDMPWGYTGPSALTWYLKQYGLEGMAAPIDVFYPVHYEQAGLLLDPDLSISDLVTHRTVILHLSNEVLRHRDLSNVPPTSPLGTILAS
jgi:hypothetical protein